MMFWKIYSQMARAKRNQWIAYSAIGLLFIFLYLGSFPAVQKASGDLDKIYSSLPKGVLAAFNITETTPTLMGFFASKHFGFTWPLMIILLMISFANSAIVREIETKTMGFLLSQPVSRAKIYIGRFVTGLVGLLVFVIVSEITVWPLAKLYNYAVNFSDVFHIGVLGFAFGIAVLGIAMLFSSMFSETGKATAFSGGAILLMYIAYLASVLVDGLKNIGYLSIFHYFAPGDVISSGRLDGWDVLVLLLAGLVTALAGLYIFQRRDIEV